MKIAFYALILLAIGIVTWELIWMYHGKSQPATTTVTRVVPHAVNTIANYPITPPPALDPREITPAEWTHLQEVRDATLKANPDLAAEYKALLSEQKTQQAKFDAYIIKADPKIGPLVSKIVAMREQTLHKGAATPDAK